MLRLSTANVVVPHQSRGGTATWSQYAVAGLFVTSPRARAGGPAAVSTGAGATLFGWFASADCASSVDACSCCCRKHARHDVQIEFLRVMEDEQHSPRQQLRHLGMDVQLMLIRSEPMGLFNV
jgi:hypothetical protein